MSKKIVVAVLTVSALFVRADVFHTLSVSEALLQVEKELESVELTLRENGIDSSSFRNINLEQAIGSWDRSKVGTLYETLKANALLDHAKSLTTIAQKEGTLSAYKSSNQTLRRVLPLELAFQWARLRVTDWKDETDNQNSSFYDWERNAAKQAIHSLTRALEPDRVFEKFRRIMSEKVDDGIEERYRKQAQSSKNYYDSDFKTAEENAPAWFVLIKPDVSDPQDDRRSTSWTSCLKDLAEKRVLLEIFEKFNSLPDQERKAALQQVIREQQEKPASAVTPLEIDLWLNYTSSGGAALSDSEDNIRATSARVKQLVQEKAEECSRIFDGLVEYRGKKFNSAGAMIAAGVGAAGSGYVLYKKLRARTCSESYEHLKRD